MPACEGLFLSCAAASHFAEQEPGAAEWGAEGRGRRRGELGGFSWRHPPGHILRRGATRPHHAGAVRAMWGFRSGQWLRPNALVGIRRMHASCGHDPCAACKHACPQVQACTAEPPATPGSSSPTRLGTITPPSGPSAAAAPAPQCSTGRKYTRNRARAAPAKRPCNAHMNAHGCAPGRRWAMIAIGATVGALTLVAVVAGIFFCNRARKRDKVEPEAIDPAATAKPRVRGGRGGAWLAGHMVTQVQLVLGCRAGGPAAAGCASTASRLPPARASHPAPLPPCARRRVMWSPRSARRMSTPAARRRCRRSSRC
jgi:hypothetical protein